MSSPPAAVLPGAVASARVALVLHPSTVDVAAVTAAAERAAQEHGQRVVQVAETTEADPGTGLTRQLVDDGCDLVVCAGGDGTVRAVATALAGSRVPLGILPAGTGNLLARNLELPDELDQALQVALTGAERRLDCGRVGDERFLVMAGLGLDAAMVGEAPSGLKKALGWPAYVVSGARHLGDSAMRLRFRIDDGDWQERRARTLVAGNVGELQAGLALFPEADPGDGVLELAVLCPRSLTDWLRVARALLDRSGTEPLERHSFHRLEVTTSRPEPYELDGDAVGRTSRLVLEVEPGALTVRVPR